ncbi:unnamed protein product [Brachionus calyciflorus]|uniref:Uncharacterized protein n=1 Tax=Brachionus calyciflorus TaxID=104777 RepID=A0A814JW30_9BILA|nr:unnamed protein product [Brachionus calyciflorus]
MGGNVKRNGKLINISNTCTIDYYLLAFWYLSKIKKIFYQNETNTQKVQIINEILISIENLNWERARELWTFEINNFNLEENFNSISLFGSEYEKFFQHISIFQRYNLIQRCKKTCIQNNKLIRDDSDNLFFKKINNRVVIYTGYNDKCHICKINKNPRIKLKDNPDFLIIQSINSNIYLNELPKQFRIGKNIFPFLCATIHRRNHFIGIFEVNEELFVIDDLDQSMTPLPSYDKNKPSHFYRYKTTLSLYFLI